MCNDTSLRSLSPLTILRLGGAFACLLDGIFTVMHRFRSPATFANLGDAIFGIDFNPVFMAAMDVISFVLVAASFWYLAQERHMVAPTKTAVGVLVFQVLLTLFISPGINYLGSAQAGFLFSLRTGLIWMAVQSVVEIAVYSAYPGVGDVLPMYLQSLSPAALWLASAATALSYHLLAFGLGYMASSAVRQRLELTRRNAELEATQQLEADSARLAERLTIARDLHDELGHHLTALSLHLQMASKQTDGAAKQTVDTAYLMARTVLSDVRSTVTDLRSQTAVRLPLALQTLIGGITGPMVHLTLGPGVEQVDPLPSHALFRSAQELITNAIRHSAASNLWIDLHLAPGVYRLAVRDDGRGAGDIRLGNGLQGIVERVEGLGGTAEFFAGGRNGFCASIELPRKTADLN